jgi:predicted amidohydrolase YtcJ
MTFANVNGQTGAVSVETTTPFSFAGNLVNNAAVMVLTDGALTINGQELALAVVKPDVVTLTTSGNPAKPYSWPFLGGPLRLGFALRPTVADTILLDGNFLTINDAAPKAEALAILDGRILAVGTEAEVTAFQANTTEVFPLGGGTCLPGFVEPHMHISLTALTMLSNVNPQVVPCGTQELGYTIDEALAALTQGIQTVPDAGAIFGFNFDPSRLSSENPNDLMQSLTLADLDGVSTTVPVVVQNASLHISYANSAAFRATGIWPTAPNPPYTPPDDDTAQFIVVDPDTQLPTGQLNEFSQNAFVQMALTRIVDTPQAQAQYLEQWRAVMDVLAARGVTAMSDQLTGAVLGLEPELELLNALALDPTNPVRIRSYFDSSIFIKDSATDLSTLNLFPGEGYDRLRVIGTKFVLDGSTQGLTAGLNFPYIFPGPFPVAPDGLMDFASAAAVVALAQPFYDKGFQLCFHANGDRAQDQLFMVVDALRSANPRPNPRTRLEHFTVHQPSSLDEAVASARELDLHVSVTIGHVFFWGQVFSETLLGSDVADLIDPIRSLMEAGVVTSTHSDSPVVTCDPLRNVETASTRLWQGIPQEVLGADQTIPVQDALKTVTINAAHSLFLEKQVGSLEVGKLADLAVLEQDPTAVASDQIAEINVSRTYLAGKALFVAP